MIGQDMWNRLLTDAKNTLIPMIRPDESASSKMMRKNILIVSWIWFRIYTEMVNWKFITVIHRKRIVSGYPQNI